MAEAGPLIDNDYLKEHYLHVYLEDAIAQFLANRQEGNKSPTMKPSKFFKEYFTSVHQGTHVLFREYEFVSATPYNRLCVLKAILQIYKSFLYHEERYNTRDYHSILTLVWPDFRMQIVQDAFNASDDDKKDEENRMKFLDFVKALKESFCTGDFDYEAGIMNDQLNERIEECSNVDSSSSLAEQLNAEDSVGKSPWSKIMDGSEFKRILSLNDSNSVSSDEPISGTAGKISHSSSESKDISKSEKTKKTKKSEGKGKTRGRLPGKGLSSSLNLLQNEKGDDKKGKHRHRSKSVTSERLQKNHPGGIYL